MTHDDELDRYYDKWLTARAAVTRGNEALAKCPRERDNAVRAASGMAEVIVAQAAALGQCVTWFRGYGDDHKAKGETAKAERNYTRAGETAAAMAGSSQLLGALVTASRRDALYTAFHITNLAKSQGEAEQKIKALIDALAQPHEKETP